MNNLRRAVDSFATFIRGLPPHLLQPSRTAEWGPREVLCHLAFWHEQYAAILEAIQDGREPPLINGTFKSINASAVATILATPPAELLHRLVKAQESLERITRNPDAESLAFSFRKGSKVWPLPKAIELIAGHMNLHEQRLRRATRAPD
ncbi:MAG TPA: maleylpyruvate isomerase N-terminal domain-containing protein [Dehalococcoidia bacterium]|nr:maleylpyruvate isomerase N-terminal domain-containing protein [Dehalococcoidia bacterium]